MSNRHPLNSREQRLLRFTLLVVGLVSLFLIGFKGLSTLEVLETRIAQAEQDLLSLHTQSLHQQSVDKAFQTVLTPHTTAQSKEEIHDSLRREIYRLALRNPNAAGAGKLKDKAAYLIHIPELKEGVFRSDSQGYQEYQIRFRVPSSTLLVALEYLKRLETSKLLLRIDSIEITRSHDVAKQVSLHFEVTRTILSDSMGEGDA